MGLGSRLSRALRSEASRPLAQRILGELSMLLGDWLGAVELSVDTDQISELAEDRAHLWAQVAAADCITRDEKRAMLGFAPTPTSRR